MSIPRGRDGCDRRCAGARGCFLVLAAAVACGPALHPIPANLETDPGVLLARFSRWAEAIPSLAAEARLENYGPREVVKGRVTLVAERSGRLRVDAWTPTDQHLAVLLADREAFFYHERGAPECLSGLSCPRNLARLLPIGLGVREAVGVLFGVPPVYAPQAEWTMTFDRRAGAYELQSAVAGGAEQRLWLLPDGTPIRAELRQAGALAYRVEFSRHESLSGTLRPFAIHVVVPSQRSDLTIRYREIEPGVSPDEEDFVASCPEGLPTRVVPCED